MRPFAKFLWEQWRLEPETTLLSIERALDNLNNPGARRQYFDAEELIRLVLRIYSDPASTDAIRQASMDVFDKLMGCYSGWAYRVLEEWDRV